MSGLRVGFIGLGSMGGDQARCIIAKGLDLTVHDAYPPALEAFSGKAKLASSVAELARDVDVVGICVRDDQQVRDTLEGPAGLLAHLKPGAAVLVHSTVRPETIQDLARQAEACGVSLLDASVTRTRMQGEGPFVGVMLGASPEALEKVRPVLDAYATSVVHAGPVGAGVAMKIVNNLVTWSSIVTITQAMRLATAGGVDPAKLIELMSSNGNLTPVTKAVAGGLVAGTRDLAFMESQAGIGDKDLQLAAEFAASVGVNAPVAEEARASLREAMLGG